MGHGRGGAAYWLFVGVLALLTGGWVASVVGEAQERGAQFGATRPVLVATRPLAPGVEVAADDVERRDLPVALLPAADLPDQAEGRTVRHAVEQGEPLVETRLAPPGSHGPDALVTSGHRSLTLPARQSSVAARPGDLADLVAVNRLDGLPATVARSVRVLEVADDGGITVAVDPAEVEATAAALVDGTIVLAIHH